MICYLEGKLFRKNEDKVLVLAGGVGYEVFVVPICRGSIRKLRAGKDGEEIKLYISYHHSAHQPRPVLILGAVGAAMMLLSTALPLDDLIPAYGSNPAIFLALVALTVSLALARVPSQPSGAATVQPPRVMGVVHGGTLFPN